MYIAPSAYVCGLCMYVRLCTCSLERSCAGRNLRSLLRPNGQGAGKGLGNQANTEGLLMYVHMTICMYVPGLCLSLMAVPPRCAMHRRGGLFLSLCNGGASPVRCIDGEVFLSRV